jgi:dipeptidyl aminopeptidase/acylaminoacyl peptidase
MARTSRLASLVTLALLGCGPAPSNTPPPAVTAPVATTAAPSAQAKAAPPAQTEPAKPAQPPPVTLQQMLDVHKATAPRALDGQRFLFLSDAPGTAQLFTSTTPADPAAAPPAPEQLSSFPDRVSALRVAPGGKYVVFLKDTGGDENDQIFELDLDRKGTAPHALTQAPKVKHTLPAFDDAGKRMAFTSNARNGKDMDLYVEPTHSYGESFGHKPLVELAGSFAVADFRGDQVLVVEARSSFDQDLWLVDAKTKKKKLLTKHEGDERYASAHFSRDGKAIFVLTDAGREYLTLTAIDVASGKRTEVLALDHDIDDAALPVYASKKAAKGQPEDVAVVKVNMDGVEEVSVVSIDGKRKVIERKPAGISGVVSSIDVAPGGEAAFIALERPDMPTEIFRVDLGKATAARVTKSFHGGIDESRLVPAELVTVKSFDGKPVSFFWYQRKGGAGERQPVVVSVHGGPEGQAQPLFSPVTQYLALSGYAVATPNVRGSTGYGKTFAHLDDKDKREDSVRDLHEVAKAIAARPDVDGSRMAVLGGSYGGYMVLAALTLYPEQWAAGVDIVGIANFRTFLEQTAPYRRALREAEYGSLDKDGPLLDKLSPIHKVDRIAAPLMVIHGTRDPRVPIGEAKQIAEAVKKRGLPVELLTFEDEGHGLAKRKNRLVAYPAMMEFLDRYVKNRTKKP